MLLNQKTISVIIPIIFFSTAAMIAYFMFSVLRSNNHQIKLKYLENRDGNNTKNGTLKSR